MILISAARSGDAENRGAAVGGLGPNLEFLEMLPDVPSGLQPALPLRLARIALAVLSAPELALALASSGLSSRSRSDPLPLSMSLSFPTLDPPSSDCCLFLVSLLPPTSPASASSLGVSIPIGKCLLVSSSDLLLNTNSASASAAPIAFSVYTIQYACRL